MNWYQILFFSALTFFGSCYSPISDDTTVELTVFDVGQGLSQLVKHGDSALMFDVGPQQGWQGWVDGYQTSGAPALTSIVISHADLDHCGGLSLLDSTVNWSGNLICGFNADTIYLYSLLSPYWKKKVRFLSINAGDTVYGIQGVTIQCLWPENSADSSWKCFSQNQLSTVFLVKYNSTSLLISSDIDSFSGNEIMLKWQQKLKADILIVPHHGSASSVHNELFGYVNPSIAVVSCGAHNSYGHPSDKMLQVINGMGVPVYITAEKGVLCFSSNGWYWSYDD